MNLSLKPLAAANPQRPTLSRNPRMHCREMIVMVMLSILIVASEMGCISDRNYNDAHPKYGFKVEFSTIQSYRLNDSLFWEINGPITDLEGYSRSNWSDLRIVLFTGYPSREENYSFQSRPTNRANVLSFYCIEKTGNPNRPDEGDIIGVLGLTRMHQNAFVVILERGTHRVADTSITSWNETFSLTLSKGPTLIPKPARAPNVTITVESMAPDWERIGWSDIGYQIGKYIYANAYPILPFPANDSQNITTGVYFREVGIPNGLIDPGERIEIVGISDGWFGDVFMIRTGKVEIGRRDLPNYFT